MNLLPNVLKKGSVRQDFNPEKIYDSLVKETSLTLEQAMQITEDTTRFLVSKKLKLITAPLIREIVNFQLLSRKFEKVRLEYTRIGFPFYDLGKIVDNGLEVEDAKELIYQHVKQEYKAVKELIFL